MVIYAKKTGLLMHCLLLAGYGFVQIRHISELFIVALK
jgi:hypothetical protein